MLPDQLNDLIRRRRAIFPSSYIPGQTIERELIEQVLENANWAPTHRLTEPWRFHVFAGTALEKLADYMGEHFRKSNPGESFSEVKYQKVRGNPLRSGAVIALVLQRDPEARVPEWEEIAALACAVQNMWLTCTANGIGCYWSTPRAALEGTEFLGLGEGQRCMGLFYMGYHEAPDTPGKRGPVSEKTVWVMMNDE